MSGSDTDRESGTLLPLENYDAEAAATNKSTIKPSRCIYGGEEDE